MSDHFGMDAEHHRQEHELAEDVAQMRSLLESAVRMISEYVPQWYARNWLVSASKLGITHKRPSMSTVTSRVTDEEYSSRGYL